jgi:hypothetical protein
MIQEKRISQAKLAANRENAQKSTGPKDTSVTRYNAIKHGLMSKDVLMAGESKQELAELGRQLRAEMQPEGELEEILVDRIVSSVWRLKRSIRIETGYIEAEYEDCKYSRLGHDAKSPGGIWNSVVTRELSQGNGWLNLSRYETMLEKQIYRALHELQRLQSARRGERPPLPVAIDVDVSSQS